MSNKVKLYHSNVWGGFVGRIESEEMYEEVKQGKRNWTPSQMHKIKAVQIPFEVFSRLMQLDRTVTTVPFEVEVENQKGAE